MMPGTPHAHWTPPGPSNPTKPPKKQLGAGDVLFPQHLVEGLLFSRRRVYDRSGRKSVICFLRVRCFAVFLLYEGLFNKYFIMQINNFRTRFSLHKLFLFYEGLFNKDSIMQIHNFRTRFSLHKLS